MKNSVLDNIDFGDFLSELEQSVSGYKTSGRFTVFVEGIDDAILYSNFFNSNNVAVEDTSGVHRLTEIVKYLDSHGLEKYFIAIKDSDFDRLNNLAPAYNNLFLTDKHDLETTIISVSAIEKLLKETLRYSDVKKEKKEAEVIDGRRLIDNACDMILDISYIRWYNNENNKNINFDILKFQEIISENGSLECKFCLKYLMDNPCNSKISISLSDIYAFKESHKEINDILQLVRGHDLCEALYILIKQNSYYRKKSNLSSDKIEEGLRLCCGIEQFRKTELYSNIKCYFENNCYIDMFAC